MNNNKKQSNLQFTELTSDDKATHEDLYIDLMAAIYQSVFIALDGKNLALLREYSINETLKANDIFQRTFESTFK